MDIEKANAEATERMMEARPVLVGLGKARDVSRTCAITCCCTPAR